MDCKRALGLINRQAGLAGRPRAFWRPRGRCRPKRHVLVPQRQQFCMPTVVQPGIRLDMALAHLIGPPRLILTSTLWQAEAKNRFDSLEAQRVACPAIEPRKMFAQAIVLRHFAFPFRSKHILSIYCQQAFAMKGSNGHKRLAESNIARIVGLPTWGIR